MAFLAETQGSATVDEQKASLCPGDYVLEAGQQGFHKLEEILDDHDVRLVSGDRLKVFDLSCIAVSTTTLIRVFTKLLKAGISLEIISPGIVLEPGAENKLHALLDALDGHYRHVHGIKTHPTAAAGKGRKPTLDPARFPEIRAKLDEPGATTGSVASELKVARSTLFAYLDRYDQDRQIKRVERAKLAARRRRGQHADKAELATPLEGDPQATSADLKPDETPA